MEHLAALFYGLAVGTGFIFAGGFVLNNNPLWIALPVCVIFYLIGKELDKKND
jgi:hypothetical protein